MYSDNTTEKNKNPPIIGLGDFIGDSKDEYISNHQSEPQPESDQDKFRRSSMDQEKENPFPVEVFSSLFRWFINECSKSLNFPTDYTGTAILAAVSTAIGKGAKLKIKEGWYEFPAFYIAIVGNAGANKSHPLDLVFKPFQEIDRVTIQRFEQEYNAYEAFQGLGKKEKEGQPKPTKPKLVKTVLHNFTPEILCQRLADNNRGCTVVSEELATFLQGMNNYSKGDQTSVYLSFWSNKPTSIDRVKTPVPLWLPQPFLNILGSLQPRVLPKLFPAAKSDNGFLQRFLFAYPDNAEKQPINNIEISETLMQEYSDWITCYRLANPILTDPETELPKPKLYYWSEAAKQFFYKWQKENTEQVNENADSLKGEILSKFDIHFVRLCLVLQVMTDYGANQISLTAVQGAAKLCAYFQRTALKVLDILQSGNPAAILPQNKLNLYNALPGRFTTAEAIGIGATIDNGKGRGFDEKAVARFIANENLFVKLGQGQYSKK